MAKSTVTRRVVPIEIPKKPVIVEPRQAILKTDSDQTIIRPKRVDRELSRTMNRMGYGSQLAGWITSK